MCVCACVCVCVSVSVSVCECECECVCDLVGVSIGKEVMAEVKGVESRERVLSCVSSSMAAASL